MREFVLTGETFEYLMSSVLNAGQGYRVKVRGRGYSMIPFIKDNDAVMLKPVDPLRGIKFGDIVAVSSRNKGKIVIHRIIGSKKGRYQTKGDNNLKADAWCTINDIIGMVNNIKNNGWIPYACAHWQNVIIAIGSKTGLLNRILYPGYLYLRNLVK
jgi:signal peptidase I